MHSAQAHRALVERLETQARQAPGTYRLKLALLAGLGYAVLGVSVLLALGMTVGLLGLVALTKSWVLAAKFLKLFILPLGLAWLILRALWVRIPPPEGYHLRPGEAPELEAEVERLRAATGAPALAGIVIDQDLNAAAASVPRALGLLGNRHYLVLGLPLMQLLDRPQFASVVAHEFGHFGGGHGRFSGWIYRVRESWFRVLDALAQQRAWASGLYTRFFNWYAPYFNAYSFVLARANEYEADAAAARVAGAGPAGEALARVNLGALRLHEDFWPAIDRDTSRQPRPPHRLYVDMARALRSQADDDAQRLQEVLARTPGLDDTHPVLAQRLAALGVAPALPAPPRESAAEALLGPLLPALEARFSDEWADWAAPRWEARYQEAEADRRRLADLDARAAAGPLDGVDAVEHACLLQDFRPGLDPLPGLEAALARCPEHAGGTWRLGCLRLERGDPRGAETLRRVIRLDPQATEMVLRRLGDHYHAIGDARALDGIRDELARHHATLGASDVERGRVHRKDVYLPHGLDGAQIDALKAALDRLGGVASVWVVRKRLDDDGGAPHFVVLARFSGLVIDEGRRLQALVDALPLPGTSLAFGNSADGGTQRRIRKAAGEPVYRR